MDLLLRSLKMSRLLKSIVAGLLEYSAASDSLKQLYSSEDIPIISHCMTALRTLVKYLFMCFGIDWKLKFAMLAPFKPSGAWIA